MTFFGSEIFRRTHVLVGRENKVTFILVLVFFKNKYDEIRLI